MVIALLAIPILIRVYLILSTMHSARFADPWNDDSLIAPGKEKYWLPVDLYVGGAEHAVLHLLYARFWHKVLFDVVTSRSEVVFI